MIQMETCDSWPLQGADVNFKSFEKTKCNSAHVKDEELLQLEQRNRLAKTRDGHTDNRLCLGRCENEPDQKGTQKTLITQKWPFI